MIKEYKIGNHASILIDDSDDYKTFHVRDEHTGELILEHPDDYSFNSEYERSFYSFKYAKDYAINLAKFYNDISDEELQKIHNDNNISLNLIKEYSYGEFYTIIKKIVDGIKVFYIRDNEKNVNVCGDDGNFEYMEWDDVVEAVEKLINDRKLVEQEELQEYDRKKSESKIRCEVLYKKYIPIFLNDFLTKNFLEENYDKTLAIKFAPFKEKFKAYIVKNYNNTEYNDEAFKEGLLKHFDTTISIKYDYEPRFVGGSKPLLFVIENEHDFKLRLINRLKILKGESYEI